MEPRPEFHPVYVSGQYLTSEHLNETQNFLWQEEKATRYIVAGNGIVNGLVPDFSGNTHLEKLSVTSGGAATVDGYLLQAAKNLLFDRGVDVKLVWFKTAAGAEQLMDKTEFDKIKATLNPVSETILNTIELIPEGMPANELPVGVKILSDFAITSGQALAGYLVLAGVFIKDKETTHCQQADCNSKGIQRNYVTRYFLVQNNQIPQLNSVSPEMQVCSVIRIKNLADAGSPQGLNQKSFAAWSSSAGILLPYFSANPSGKQLGIIASVLGAAEQAALTQSIQKFALINGSVNNLNCPQYYNLFAGDLAKAINELILFYNEYSRKYPVFNPNRIEGAILLGSFRVTGVDKWRYYFIPAPGQVQFDFEKKKLRLLFRRVLSLVNTFVLQSSIVQQAAKVINKPLAIPTLNGHAPLQHCAIPYYYDSTTPAAGNEVLQYWNPQGGDLKNIFCYYDSIIANRADMAARLATADWYNYNFFRIEGHIGMAKDAAISAVNALIVSQGLPIQLIDCDINYKGPKKWNDWYTEFAGKLSLWTKELRKDPTIQYDYSPVKNVQMMIEQTSYRNIDQVTKITNDFYAYSGVIYNKKPLPPGSPPVNTELTDKAINKFKSVVPKTEVELLMKKYKDAVAEQTDNKAQKLVTLKDLTEIEYMGGAPRGGTFVLLHNANTVIGDGCLPYYYRINQVRVYSAK